MKLNRLVMLAGVVAMLCLSASMASAQDRPQRGNWDPEQMKQRMMDRYREQLEIKDDEEWKLISARIDKVVEARREAGTGMMGFGRGGRPPGPPAGGGDAAATPGGGGGGRRGGFGADTSPEGEELQKAIESKASAEDLKAKIAKLREARKAKEAKYEKAQEDLRKVLTTRQEASAILAGLLK